jgi:hypothetical protein
MDIISNDKFMNPDIFNVLNDHAIDFDEEYIKPEMIELDELPDGSSIFGTPETLEEIEEEDFYENLAENMEEGKLDSIASLILEGIEQDKQSRQQWEQACIKGMKYLGFKLEESKDVPFLSACRAFDPTLSTAVLRFHSTLKPELFPDEGPVDIKIMGPRNDFLEHKGSNVKDSLNYYLTEDDKEYYPDSDRLLMYLITVGCAFRKAYQDPITNKPILRFIDPKDCIINNDCVTILSSTRITHDEQLTRKDIKLRQQSGFYRDIELPNIDDDNSDENGVDTKKQIERLEGINLDTYEKKSLYHVYESHVDLDDFDDNSIKKEGIPKPYIVSICKTSRKILSIRRNWKENDNTYKRIEYFVHHKFISGYGIYGLGLIQLIGSNSIVLTSLLRQLIDAGTLKNFPGGLMVAGLRTEDNNKAIGPAEFRRIETGGLPIQQAIMPMPYNEPSVVLKDLRNELIQQTQALTSTLETAIAEGNPNAPVGTTLALMEIHTKIQSGIFSSLRKSLEMELTLLYNLFKNNFSNDPFSFKMPGKNIVLTREDFIDEIVIVHNSDPKLTTSAQRILTAEANIRTAQAAPQIHNMVEVFKQYYSATGLSDDQINLILIKQEQAQPLDPITENMNAMQGKPLMASMEQDHQAHIITHMPYAQDPSIGPSIQAHIKQHEAFQYLIDMQMSMGIMMPQPEMLQDPQVQNEIAVRAAQVTQEKMAQQQQQEQAQQPIDPNQVMMADIAQREAKTISDEKIAMLKAEEAAFETQMKFEAEKMKIEANREMAQEKLDKDILLAQMKSH